jgi:hypothetical protein
MIAPLRILLFTYRTIDIKVEHAIPKIKMRYLRGFPYIPALYSKHGQKKSVSMTIGVIQYIKQTFYLFLENVYSSYI